MGILFILIWSTFSPIQALVSSDAKKILHKLPEMRTEEDIHYVSSTTESLIRLMILRPEQSAHWIKTQ